MNGRRIASFLILIWMAAWAGGSLWGAVALPNGNVFRIQGPDTTGLVGFPLAVVPATGSAAFPVSAGTTVADADTLATQTTGTNLVFNHLFNGTTFDRLRDANTGQNTTGTGVAGAAALVWDGTKYQRTAGVTLSGNTYLQDSLGTALAGEDLPNNIMRVGGKGGTWCKTHAPTAGTQATISQAAGGGAVKNVCTALSVGITCNTSAPTPTVETATLRDGASGAGTILMSWSFVPPAVVGTTNTVSLGGLWIEGSANTAMTLEFTAGLANTLEFVNVAGTTLP